jgi:UDP-N-acetylglucosamine/UDP-N-acetylgalactosamine diphosphorylase
VPCVDLSTGERVDPSTPNAVKLEAFVFDALPLAKNPILVGTSRAEEFSPVKNKTGVDSVDTARRDMSLRAARWLERAGMKIPRDAQGNPTASYEISPLVALDAEELAQRAAAGGLLPAEPPVAGEGFYLKA